MDWFLYDNGLSYERIKWKGTSKQQFQVKDDMSKVHNYEVGTSLASNWKNWTNLATTFSRSTLETLETMT